MDIQRIINRSINTTKNYCKTLIDCLDTFEEGEETFLNKSNLYGELVFTKFTDEQILNVFSNYYAGMYFNLSWAILSENYELAELIKKAIEIDKYCSIKFLKGYFTDDILNQLIIIENKIKKYYNI